MDRLTLVGRRLVQLIPVLFGISVISFLLMHFSPGDPIRLLLGGRASDAAIAAMRARYGLDQPLVQQYLTFLVNLFHGDLGRSILYGRPVGQIILQFMPTTLLLIAYIVCISVPTAMVLAIIAARNQGSWIDQLIRLLSVCGMAIPVFWLAIMLLRLFSVNLEWFPVSGYGDTFLEHLHHLFLPAISTSAWVVPILLRNLRSEILEQMQADYVTASYAKGLPERYIFNRHIVKNSILPSLHLLGVIVAFLIAGTIVVEVVFSLPGLGQLMIAAIIGRDYHLLQGLTLFYALFTVSVTLVIDILSTLIDPRVKL